MNETLFPLPESPSPRLKRLAKHNVRVENHNGWWRAGERGAWPQVVFGRGETEDEAITNWAIVHGVKLWNEEQV